jgi:hypothetical protein
MDKAMSVAVILAVFMGSAVFNAAYGDWVLLNSKCYNDQCSAGSQHCAYGGNDPPPQCTYCSGSGELRGFCGWAVTTCTGTANVACGNMVIGLCRDHVCSGGGGDPNTPCSAARCEPITTPPGPVP